MSEEEIEQNLNWEIELTSEDYSPDKFRQALQVKPRSLTALKLNSNLRPTIVKEISNISMAELRVLNLAFNNIVSVEPLQHISLPALKQLHLFHNNINNLRSLKKCHMPQLSFLSVVANKLVSLQHLPQCHFPQLKALMAYDNDIVTIAGLLKAEPSIEHMVLSDYLEEDWVSRALLSWRFVEYCPSQ